MIVFVSCVYWHRKECGVGILWHLHLNVFPMSYSNESLLDFQHLLPTAVWAWGQSEQRENTPLSMDLKLGDLRGQTPVSTGASPSEQVQDPASWIVCCLFGLGGSTAVKEENM